MPKAYSMLDVCIFGHGYTLKATAAACQHLPDLARQLDEAMRAQKTKLPAAGAEQLAVLAALDLLSAAVQRADLHDRDIAEHLHALQHKLDRLETAMTSQTLMPSAPTKD